jgi:predicted PurR-regulated permease PerM
MQDAQELFDPSQKTSGWELKVLALLATVFIFYIAHSILFPLLLSFFLYSLLNPIMRFLLLLKIPRILASGLITISLLALISFGISFLMEPAAQWIDKAPEDFQVIEEKFSFIKKPLGKLTDAIKRAQNIAEVKKVQLLEVRTETRSIGYSLFDLTTNAIMTIFITAVFLFFLLIYIKTFFDNLAKVSTYRQTKITSNFFLTIQNEISTYLLTFTIICICLGIAIAVELSILGVPSAPLWGVMAACVNYIPYIGPAIGIGVVFFISLLTFDNYIQILLPPLCYFLTCVLEGQIITPILIGHRMNLNPFIVFFSIIFWGWLWGISGALLSIPLLSMAKIILENIPSLSKYSLLLEE